MHVFKIFIFDFKNVHPILDFLTRRRKFISYFSDFYLFLYAIFSAEHILKKKYTRLPDWAEAQPKPGRPARALLLPHAAGVRREHEAAAASGFAPSPSPIAPPPTYI